MAKAQQNQPAPAQASAGWANPLLTLYHGTTQGSASAILNNGIVLGQGNARTDFGQGFYATTLPRQAQRWATTRAIVAGGQPAVVAFDVDRDALATLEFIAFVRGDAAALDFWNLVAFCRGGGAAHGRQGNAWYDVAIGPVAKQWRAPRSIWRGFDQISFHSPQAVNTLSNARVVP